MTWTQPICEMCWVQRCIDEGKAYWEDGDLYVKQAVRLREPHDEVCAWCGEHTLYGAYVRADPKSVPYPRESRG